MNIKRSGSSMTNSLNALTPQAKIVFLAALVPLITALTKYRWIDAAVLAVSGLLSVYNMTCLSSGKTCTMWAWILSVTFAGMVAFEFLQEDGPKPEFMKTETEKAEEAAPVSELEAAEDDDEMLNEEVL
jgi:hypothetical protein